ncbi:hypothetical protein QOZ52_13925 [Pseudomonas aeruginosa]|uniref:hypothetical protein n=1 Tax=Pseudomonas aeruginosa TaxID=287 RepID=UPI0003B93F86|nr:hypothetical protein [Pseudomonas aeruginosa]ERV70145.1 hypothetical protein Q061_01933 [Pseudomonas aeruginosa BL07]MBG4983073.1 hypothetical protein [Pseudomonas aeruginosa]MBG6829918.1 hypothetical protein [Pseudomonas aeruginosa]HEJ3825011.1 hypothetical protein [Pseudomonas aeruginosa]
MPVFLLPDFIADLQEHNDANFARRVLQKTIKPDGSFRPDSDDHPYEGIDGAWIRYVSRQATAYRVIFLRKGENIYLFRAGEHSVEDHLKKPGEGAMKSAVPVEGGDTEVSAVVAAITEQQADATLPQVSRFKRNISPSQIHHEIFSRRNLPHKDIWLVTPSVDEELFAPTKAFGKLLLEQAEDGASVVIITAPPKDKNIEWMEKLAERNIGIYLYPRLNSKLYCFLFDDNRRYETGLIEGEKYSSLILVGSSDLTAAGVTLGSQNFNEELCYSAPENEACFVEEYVTELMSNGYDLPEVRRLLARGQWQKLENRK